jgi:glycosyltransferase involved in cell wall biosynthesis
MKPKVVAVVVDDGEPTLERCLLSLRNQTHPLSEVVVASGLKTDLNVARRLADRVLNPVEGIGKARVQAILSCNAEYIISCDSDSVYDPNYVKYAVEDLQRGARAVKAGVILPLEWKNPLAVLESIFTFLPPYEYAIAFRKSEALKAGLLEEAGKEGDNPRWDIGWFIANRLNALPDFRMLCYTRLPTYGANYIAENYLVSALAGTLIPIGTVSLIVGFSELGRGTCEGCRITL